MYRMVTNINIINLQFGIKNFVPYAAENLEVYVSLKPHGIFILSNKIVGPPIFNKIVIVLRINNGF